MRVRWEQKSSIMQEGDGELQIKITKKSRGWQLLEDISIKGARVLKESGEMPWKQQWGTGRMVNSFPGIEFHGVLGMKWLSFLRGTGKIRYSREICISAKIRL